MIISASPAISKIFYEAGYQEGDAEAPDCFSTNGVSPDPASPKKQAELCASCPQNRFGSRANLVTGAKGKACQDSKRLAVVPADDMHNETFGGPMLLRIPPASLQGMGTYNAHLQNAGHTFYSVKSFQYQYHHHLQYKIHLYHHLVRRIYLDYLFDLL